MTAKELIEELQKVDPETVVKHSYCGTHGRKLKEYPNGYDMQTGEREYSEECPQCRFYRMYLPCAVGGVIIGFTIFLILKVARVL